MEQRKSSKKKANKEGWDDAIAEARRRIRELQFAIGQFKRRKRAGDPWPPKPETTSA